MMAVEDVLDSPRGGETSATTLDVDRPDATAYTALATELRDRVDGDVKFDEYAQVLYATDGSIYQARPAGVVLPRDADDVRATVETAANHGVPVLPRGTGSSLGGQTVGRGCVVIDFTKYMDDIVDIDPQARRATVQPGCVQDHLDAALADHGLKFAPDPASSNRSTVGGGIGNNSTGAHSVRYGITDAYTEELEVILADGSLIHTREVVLDSDEYDSILAQDDLEANIYRTVRALVENHESEIENKYPSLKRSVSGYNLQKVIYENDDGEAVINLSKLFVGAEGTLGVIVEATVSLVTKPDETALALYCFDDLVDAMEAVPEALEFPVSAVELMDDEVFRLARESEGYAEYAEPIPEGAKAALMLEWDDELVDDFEAAVADTNAHFVDSGAAFDVLEAYSEESQGRLWKLRKAAIPLLMSLEGDPKPYPFIEDATVPPEELAEYVQKFEDVLENHGTSAAYFAHAGSGTLHIRPILNLKENEGIEKMHSITDDVTDLVVEHHGAFSGEHGDGMARTEFNPKMYGPELWGAFKELKTAFDPDWLFNPGNVVYRDGPSDPGPDSDRGVGADMRENLRYGPDYQSVEPQTDLDFDDEGGFSHLVELCNGCGTCRQTDSNTMCPTYRASKEEVQTTRGRANMLRAAISGELPEDELYSERFQTEVLDLCVGCKGCQSDCPTGVDMAKLKSEVKHQYHQKEGTSLRSRVFANVDTLSKLGSKLAPLSNVAAELPGSRLLLEKVLGIASERDLPSFSSESLEEWFEARGGSSVPPAEARGKVLLFPDTYTNYNYPEPGKAAVEVLEAANVHVRIPSDLESSGRAAFSMGMLDTARDRARHNVGRLRPYVDDGWSVVFVEPSDAVMFQDEYLDLLDGTAVELVSGSAYGVMEYLDAARADDHLDFDAPAETLTYHGHCNQKATNKDHHAVGVLRRSGYAVDPLDSSCCGMAGSFGYEEEHYELSKGIGEILFGQVDDSPGDVVTAPGASCRSQLGDRPGESRPPHPIEKMAEALD
ncbi:MULTISPECIES: FAD-binding and (Fe-S)-binding domain-containing protein [unclassified Haloferax]|uniref:FAD-linked oxidase C-terminal domain-containing protein n=1 Tax=Haloferax sp. Atlit-48N TaxID=2077198 RepID=A0ACD5I2W9_9EURY|nr:MULTISPECIES: FAD-binding and (Fe-S)-binding domain-containing protein [unclassified Haloferax]RDZ30871.1 FAD-binding oxidoreductase [Haloferax sp. Atlit-48N]RDZ33877.1 FAD-binding oxidoreductase [Haloferax sp. Atlit-24N]RDZ38496.1 FAD-binding oxidoreductase [Haloferax sp. Atlit-47N]RLM36256.1 FAD-binding oxidoreductase [Haloferax sp. Atlit-109R]RLM41537.1 FAD-binding oxidoreductase [Haloferax sp. Atlit-105R]